MWITYPRAQFWAKLAEQTQIWAIVDPSRHRKRRPATSRPLPGTLFTRVSTSTHISQPRILSTPWRHRRKLSGIQPRPPTALTHSQPWRTSKGKEANNTPGAESVHHYQHEQRTQLQSSTGIPDLPEILREILIVEYGMALRLTSRLKDLWYTHRRYRLNGVAIQPTL
ncbi:Hypothetical predicted protein [Pelobates cultripes]|uniref:Uncharacterized protein n=1 Tax=Pelobates cultripes TaxID=61616 RepID=A0AAD1R8C9_PELCU|nr:Hypothetical predicted protein [Pelobates cultripes]